MNLYTAKLKREGKHWLVEFPDAPGCQTFGDSKDAALAAAREALEGWLEAHLVDGEAPPKPRKRVGPTAVPIPVDPRVWVAVQIRWARADKKMSQAELARRTGVRQQQIAKIERPGANLTLATVSKIAKALDRSVAVELSAVGA